MSRLVLTSLLISISLLVPSRAARAQTSPEGDTAVRLSPVVVTGSRIRGSGQGGPAPVLMISRADLDRSGFGSIADVLQQLTASGRAINTRFDFSGTYGFPADGGGIGAGAAQVDLRHLEPKRVLVLVDGLRWVNETSGSGVSGAVDLNTIPLAIVDHIDVLEDGASAIYGSDAIAGVVNIVTRKNFQGTRLGGYYGMYDQGDGQTGSADITWGRSNTGYNLVLGASHYDQRQVSAADREVTRVPVRFTGLTRGSSATPQGRFIFCDPRITPACASGDFLNLALDTGTATAFYDPANPSHPVNDPGESNSTFHPFSSGTPAVPGDRFNYQPFIQVLTPNRRSSLFARGQFDLRQGLALRFKALYNHRDSNNRAAPEFIGLGPNAATGGIADTITIPANQPFNPFGIDLVSGDNLTFIGRRVLEGGPRVFKQKVDTIYAATGLDGRFDFAGRSFLWDFNLVASNNRAEQSFTGGYNILRISQALGDPAACAAIAGCVPLNIFGGQGADSGGSITRQMLNWIQIGQTDVSDNRLRLASVNLTGDLLQLPAGQLSFAAGYEWRRYAGSFTPDPARVSRESQAFPADPTRGSYQVNELYAELKAPLLADVRFVRSLEFNAALRGSHYSTFGSEVTSKFGLRWQVNSELLLRGTYAEGFRAPFIGELYGLAQSATAFNDPCSNAVTDADGTDTTPLETHCRSLGVPDGFEQVNLQLTTRTGGNPDLKPETSDSYTAGLLYSPDWLGVLYGSRRLDFELNWYSHRVRNAIRAPDSLARLAACIDTGDASSAFCSGIERAPDGQIVRFDNFLANTGALSTRGWDLRVNWSGPKSPLGQMSVAWQNTYVSAFHSADALGVDALQRVGYEVTDGAIPRWQSNLGLGWALANWQAAWTVRYISPVREVCSDFLDSTPNSLTNLGLCTEPDTVDNSKSLHRLGGIVYHDAQLTWTAALGADQLSVGVGVHNVFDRDPPACLNCSLNQYDASTYEAPGRFGYLQASYQFSDGPK